MKTFTTTDVAAWKRVFQNTDSLFEKAHKLENKIAELSAELSAIREDIISYEKPIVDRTGYNSHVLITKTVSPYMVEDPVTKQMIQKTDAKGRPLTKTTYEATYPKEQNYLPLPDACTTQAVEEQRAENFDNMENTVEESVESVEYNG